VVQFVAWHDGKRGAMANGVGVVASRGRQKACCEWADQSDLRSCEVVDGRTKHCQFVRNH